MLKNCQAALMALAFASLCLFSAAGAFAATYAADTAAEMKALLPKLADGDVVDLGAARMGVVRWSIPKAITIKGGVFEGITLDKPAGATFDGLTLVMPVTPATPAYQRAVLVNGGGVTIRNFSISAAVPDPAQPRRGVGLMFDGRAGSNGQIVVENGALADLDGGMGWLQQPVGVTVRNVITRNISTDAIQFNASRNVLIENFTCGSRAELPAGGHPDCIQISSAGAGVSDLTIRNIAIDGWSSGAQGLFLINGAADRGRNWTISGVRMMGLYYRGLSVANADNVKISDVVLTTAIQPVHYSMLTLDNVNGAEIRDTVACAHQRNNVTDLVETGQLTIPCRVAGAFKGADSASAMAAKASADLAAMTSERDRLAAEARRQGEIIAAVRSAVQ